MVQSSGLRLYITGLRLDNLPPWCRSPSPFSEGPAVLYCHILSCEKQAFPAVSHPVCTSPKKTLPVWMPVPSVFSLSKYDQAHWEAVDGQSYSEKRPLYLQDSYSTPNKHAQSPLDVFLTPSSGSTTRHAVFVLCADAGNKGADFPSSASKVTPTLSNCCGTRKSKPGESIHFLSVLVVFLFSAVI